MLNLLPYGSRHNLRRCTLCVTSHFARAMTVPAYKEDYRILDLPIDADQESVRKAFITLCKKYHPDSGGPDADSQKFLQIENAYRNLQKKFSNERWNVNEGQGEYGLYYEEKKSKGEDVEEYDIKHTAPQHRQYLSWDGVGSGTMSQRQQQYTQLRAAQAADRVREHRLEQLEQKGGSLSVQDQERVKKTKTRYGMERLVEDLIQESMSRGDFENLSGAGKPIRPSNLNPYVDFVTHKMNQVLIDNGFTPEWITLAKEIEEEQMAIRKSLNKEAYRKSNEAEWRKVIAKLEPDAKALNRKIQLFNLVVPILRQQMLLFNLDEEGKKIVPVTMSNKDANLLKSKDTKSNDDNFLGMFTNFFRVN